MWIFVAVMIHTALWIVVGAMHRRRQPPRDIGAEAWWWESSDRSTDLACHHALPPSHPLARLRSLSHWIV